MGVWRGLLIDNDRFDRLTRALTPGSNRRALTRLLGGVTAGVVLAPLGFGESMAKRHKHKKRPKIKRNDFGCVNVGDACQNAGQCCSSICAGKKGKKKCQAHNEGTCTPQRSLCITGSALSYCTPDVLNVCLSTTGNAGFCSDPAGSTLEANCQDCRTDQDCENLGFPPGSACVILTGPGCTVDNNDCTGVNGSMGTACLPPGA